MTGRRFEPGTTREDRPAEAASPKTVSLDDWRIRLRTDPRGTVAELLEAFARRRSEAPEVEDFFWRVLADQGTAPELAMAVLGRLRLGEAAPAPEPDAAEPTAVERLLDLDREHRVRVRGRLRMIAAEALAELVHDPEMVETIAADPVRLPEAAFVRRRRWAEAAALFAMEHDHLPPRDDTPERLARASLRYALARALHRVEGEAGRALRVMESALGRATAEAGEPGAPTWRSFAARLAFHAREWIGLRHYEAGRYTAAEAEFRAAAEAAPDTDLALAARMFAANAMIRDGRQAEARQVLDSLDPRLVDMGDDAAEQWEELRRRLVEGIGEDEPDG